MKQKLFLTLTIIFILTTTGCTLTFSSQPPATPPTPTAVVILPPTLTPTPTDTATPEPPTDTPTPEASPTDTPSPTPTLAPPTDTPSPLPSVSASPNATILPTGSVTTTPTQVLSPTATLTPVAVSATQPPVAMAQTGAGPTVRETTITLNTYDYKSALVATNPDDEVYPYPRLNHDAVGPPSPQNYLAIILENQYTQLTILPSLGGRIFRWIDKTSGKNLFYENPVIKPTRWGYRGWWLATGGMEWALPTDEHGLNEATPWGYNLYQSDTNAGITLVDTEENSGLISQVTIDLDGEHTYFSLTPRLLNPSNEPVNYKFWINGMFGLGSTQPQEGTDFVLPGNQVTLHSTGDETLPEPDETLDWPVYNGRDLSKYRTWQKYLGIFAAPAAQADFMGAYNHRTNLGVARVFPNLLARGAKIFAPGDLDPGLWTTDGSSYFELWGGLAPTFADQISLGPGEWITWQEQWYAIGDMGGFSFANKEAALNLGNVNGSVQVAVAGTHPINGNLILWQNGSEANRWPVSLAPQRPFRGSYAVEADPTTKWGLSLVDAAGQELAALGQTKIEGAPPVATPAAFRQSLPTATPTITPRPTLSIPTATPVYEKNQAPVWDETLDTLNISLTRADVTPGKPVFRLIKANFLDEFEAAGLHHVFVEALDEQGQRIVGQPINLKWADGNSIMITEDKPYPEYAANAPLYGEMGDGTYEVFVEGAASDVVSGIGLPGKHHVGYQLTFQRGAAGTTAPPLPGQGDAPAGGTPPTPTPFPTSTPASSSGGSNQSAWDPRLTELGIAKHAAVVSSGNPVFRLIKAQYQDDTESGGMHHVLIEVLNESGQRIIGQPVAMAWADGKTTMITEDKPYPEYAANAAMYGPMDQGTYRVYVEGAASDEISGLGLPGNHHVNYLLTFQRKRQ